MQLDIDFAVISLLSGFPLVLEVGSPLTKVAVVVLFASTVLIAAIVPTTTLLTRLPKWIFVLVSIGLLTAQGIFTFGSPLAGVIYWLSCRLAASVLLPVAVVLLGIAYYRNRSPRIFVPQIGIGILLGIVCLITR